MLSKQRKKPVGYDKRTIARLVGEYIVRCPGKTSSQILLAVVKMENEITTDKVQRATHILEEHSLIFSRWEYLKSGSESYVKDSSGKFATGIVYRPKQGVGLKSIEEFFNTKTARVYGPS